MFDLASLIEQDAAGAAAMIAKVAMTKRAGLSDTLKSVGDHASKAFDSIGETGRGAVVGGLSGAALGGLGGYALSRDDKRDRDPWASAMTGALAGGGLGAAIGAAPGLMSTADDPQAEKAVANLGQQQALTNYNNASVFRQVMDALSGDAPPGADTSPEHLTSRAIGAVANLNAGSLGRALIPEQPVLAAGAMGAAGIHAGLAQKSKNTAALFDAGNTEKIDPADIVGRAIPPDVPGKIPTNKKGTPIGPPDPPTKPDFSKHRSWAPATSTPGGINEPPVAGAPVKGRWIGGSYPAPSPSATSLKNDARNGGFYIHDPEGRELAGLTASSHAARAFANTPSTARGAWLADRIKERNAMGQPRYSTLAPTMARGEAAIGGKLRTPMGAGLRRAGQVYSGIEALRFGNMLRERFNKVDKGAIK